MMKTGDEPRHMLAAFTRVAPPMNLLFIKKMNHVVWTQLRDNWSGKNYHSLEYEFSQDSVCIKFYSYESQKPA